MKQDVYKATTEMIFAEEKATYPVASVIVLEVENAAPLLSPGYWHVADENVLRDSWRDRRKALDDEYDEYLARNGPAKALP